MKEEKKIALLIAAGGASRRFGNQGENKLLIELDGIPLICRTLNNLGKLPSVIIVSVPQRDEEKFAVLAERFVEKDIFRKTVFCRGGSSRTESVGNGLKVLEEKYPGAEFVAIHDGARAHSFP